MQHKIIFIIFDGLGDRPIPEFNEQTPLEAAETPHLNTIASMGVNGLVHTIERSIRPGSDVAHLSLFGYDPRKYYRGRGPFEAAGVGIDLKKGDIAFRGNVATLNQNGEITDRRVGRIDSVVEFAESINNIEIEGVKIIAHAGIGHRIAIVLRGEHLSDQVTDTDPHKTGEPILESRPLNDSEAAKKTARIINIISNKIITIFSKHTLNKQRQKDGLPLVNCLLLRGAGEMTTFPSFKEQYGLNACCIAGGGLYKGIARILGMEVLSVEGATGKPNTNADNKVKAVIDNFDKYDFFFLHFKGADSCAEDGNPQGKKEYIEKIDKALTPIVALLEKNNTVVAVTGDHTTSSRLKAHTADEVPITIAGLDVRVDGVNKFGERSAQNGGLGHMDGRHLMRYIINLIGEEPLYGN